MQPMPRIQPFDRSATYEDLLAVPDICVAEIVGGELHASPRPAPKHAQAGAAIGALVGGPFDHGRGGPGGWRILYEPELHLGPDVLVPDWAGWRRTRMPRLPDTAYFPLAPDWVCEILSPSTVRLDRTRKLSSYAREGIPYAWLVDPLVGTLEVLTLESGRWVILAAYAGTDIVHAEPFTEVSLELGALWRDGQDSQAANG